MMKQCETSCFSEGLYNVPYLDNTCFEGDKN